MSNFVSPSSWAQMRFGHAAVELYQAIPAALQAAHERAFLGHLAMGLTTNDIYGHIWQTQHEELVDRVKDIDGVRQIKPKGARYRLAVVGEQNAILYPWRYGNDLRANVDDAKMRMSEVRSALLGLNPEVPDPQGTIEQASMSEEELRAEYEELANLLKEMATAGGMVLIAYASSPQSGLLRVYWGDATQADEDGHLRWSYREELPLKDFGQKGRSADVGPVRPVPLPARLGSGGPRFDDAPLEEPDLGIRPPLTSPDTDPTAPAPETGSDD
ncbi:hypothetical protein AB5J62_23160 [Amycolatopsis sp. cg5]|uniref:hypothetical protein n=1 Tax=Amycolatopsis sp. cg5 TaxID=3238802 RepID=UPI00352584C1